MPILIDVQRDEDGYPYIEIPMNVRVPLREESHPFAAHADELRNLISEKGALSSALSPDRDTTGS